MKLNEVTGMEIGERISYLRELKGFTVNKLANLSGLSQSFVRELERGNKQPTIESLESLCFALGISIKDFFDDPTIQGIVSDPAFLELYRLDQKQRESLAEFLKSLRFER